MNSSGMCKICNSCDCSEAEAQTFVLDDLKFGRNLSQVLWQQKQTRQFCDVFLEIGEIVIPVHKCVLVVESDYFNALFSGKFSDANSKQYKMPTFPFCSFNKVLQYIYTGQIEITVKDIEDIYVVSDYLCINKLIGFCQEKLKNIISCQTCLPMLDLSAKYNLIDIKECVINFIYPHAAEMLQNFENFCLEISPTVVMTLFTSEKVNYVPESILCNFLLKWASVGNQREVASVLFNQLDPEYLTKEYATSLLKNPLFIPYLTEDKLNEYKLRLSSHNNNIILCRTRGENKEMVRLLSYNLFEKIWFPVKSQIDIQGLESMIQHKDKVYFLVSTSEDLCGYMHSAKEVKSFFSVVISCTASVTSDTKWRQLPGPNKVNLQCRLVSHINGLFVFDTYGQIEMFDDIECQWFDVGTPIFTTIPTSTLYFLPMQMDRYIYIVRIYSLGCSLKYAENTIALHLYDTISGTSRLLSKIESSDIGIEPDERFYGYSIVPGRIYLKDSTGQTRVEYNIIEESWETHVLENRIPKCFGTVWGSVQWKNSYYVVCNLTPIKQYFFQYDLTRKRLKALALPDYQLSGLLCCLPNEIDTK